MRKLTDKRLRELFQGLEEEVSPERKRQAARRFQKVLSDKSEPRAFEDARLPVRNSTADSKRQNKPKP